MRLNRRVQIQLSIFAVLSVVAATVMGIGYMRLPAKLFGIGEYKVTVELPEASGLYATSNVTYRGTEVGRVDDIALTATGVVAVMSLRSDVQIPSDLDAQVHSQTAVGEQYVALLPRDGTSAPLKDGDVIPRDRASVPADVNSLLDTTNRGLAAIPKDNLKTVIDESYTAVNGLGPDLSRLVKGSTTLALDARANLDSLTTVIEQGGPILDSQADSAGAIKAWARNLATVTAQLQQRDSDLVGVLNNGGAATGQVRDLIDRVAPTLPIVFANFASLGQVFLTYNAGVEQLLVLLPQGTAALQAITAADRNTKHPGSFLDFNLNLNVPPPCNTGFLPIQQQRNPSYQDAPQRPSGDIYCRVPQDSTLNVRGARNLPCITRPGKRAPTVKMCESDEQYVPLNDGFAWKGDPNATTTGQGIPQLPPGAPAGDAPAAAPPPPPAPVPIATAEYDPATGSYVGPDGRVYTQTNVADQPPGEKPTWQTMLLPPK